MNLFNRPTGGARTRSSLFVKPVFLLTVVIPTAIALAYYGLISSDVYVSESQFVVRSPERQAASPLGALLRGVSFGRSQDDSYTVQEYILSRDALRSLVDKIGLDKAYRRDDIDGLNRFGALDWDDSFENLHRYYRKKVTVRTDTASSITTLTVRAFTAEDARNANRILLEESEGLVNRLNDRARRDMIRFATTEVTAAEKVARDAALSMSSFRNTQGVVDPERQATVQLQQIAKLQDELIATNAQLRQLAAQTPDNPQVGALQRRSAFLVAEIDKEAAKVTGGQRSLTNKAAEFQRLALNADFANKQLASALSSLETARNEAQRQQIYLERVAQPSLPDVAQEPRRGRAVLATLLFGLAAWGILSMLLAGVREHRD